MQSLATQLLYGILCLSLLQTVMNMSATKNVNPVVELQNLEQKSNHTVPKVIKQIFDLLACSSVPLGGIPSFLTQSVQEYLNLNFQNKLALVQKEILSGESLIMTSQLEHIEIIARFHRMIQTIARTNINEKIQFAARLFARGISSTQELSTDKYEEFLQTLEELSKRELSILATLRMIELDPLAYVDSSTSENEYLPHRYWESFKKKVSQELDISPEYIYPLMKRLERTGLFSMYNGFSFGRVEEGETTAYFHEFFSYIVSFDKNHRTEF